MLRGRKSLVVSLESLVTRRQSLVGNQPCAENPIRFSGKLYKNFINVLTRLQSIDFRLPTELHLYLVTEGQIACISQAGNDIAFCG